MEKKSGPVWMQPALLGGVALILILLGHIRLGRLPPPGKFFNPFSGFWRNAEVGKPRDRELKLKGLRDPVWVAFDRRGVPHIFAQNERDLYFAQGYITARDRLWQMETQTRAAAGRLAEILGPELVERDRFQRRLGMRQAAEKSLEVMKKNQESWDAAETYAAGVNAYIRTLGRADYPLEYKLLDYAPERWTPLKTALLIKNMQWTLSGGGDDLPLSNVLAKFGPEFVAKFYPLHNPDVEPVIPASMPVAKAETPGPQRPRAGATTSTSPVNGDSLAAFRKAKARLLRAARKRRADSLTAAHPAPPDSSKAVKARADSGNALPAGIAPVPQREEMPGTRPDPDNGSNNFVLSARRTRTGFPILANDPHLDLSLPSLWYEIQLAAPGFNAYGVSLPGAPAVIVGFNRKIAWGMTNGNDDVFDWYAIRFKDSTLSEYTHDGKWKDTRKEVEAIRVRGRGIVLDTVVYTHHGPVVVKSQERPPNRNTPPGHALRWLALDASDELQAFLGIMKSKNYRDFSEALHSFHCPAQNFAFADAAGDIAMEHQGKFPRKWAGQGRFILDGREAGNDWQGWVPRDKNPRGRNPERGWLASANQDPIDSTYPYFLGAEFMNGERAERLQDLLARAEPLTPMQAMGIMLDDYDLHAEKILPALLPRVKLANLAPPDSLLLAELAAWKYRHRPGDTAPALFDLWWRKLYRSIWQDEFSQDTLRYQWPSRAATRRLIADEPEQSWYDDIQTPARETLDLLADRAFREACAELRLRGRGGMGWAAYRPVHIRHLARIDAFSRLDVATGGCPECVNAQKSGHGPSWRMVVAMGKEPRGYGIYPGGQSGNPGSPHYDDFIEDWSRGKAYALNFLAEAGSRSGDVACRFLLRGK